MSPTTPKTNNKQKTVCYLTSLILLLVAAALLSGCNRSNPEVTPSGTASPAPSPDHTKPPFGDVETPIVIRGGSIELEFNETHFPADSTTTPTKHSCPTCRLESVHITPTDRTEPETTCAVPHGGTVLIDGGGSKKDIVVTDTGQGVEIKFDHVEYKPEYCRHGGKHCNQNFKINGIKINGVKCKGCPENGKCDVEIKAKRPL
jgi:hypothetical protein